MAGKTNSHYRVLEKLGGGGVGVVYKTEEIAPGRFVALKFLPQDLSRDHEVLERFRGHTRPETALNHPCIFTIHDIGEHERQRYI